MHPALFHGRCSAECVLFLTNRANRPAREICAQLRRYGINCGEDDILTAATATARYLQKGSYFMIGEAGLREELDRVGMMEDRERPDYVIVSFDRSFDFEKLEATCRLISRGAKFVATNTDRALRLEDRLVPGTGALVAAITAVCGVEPLVMGKPNRFIVEIALARMNLRPDEVMLVGDNVETDMPAGAAAGVHTTLILTGISTREDAVRSPIKPHWIVENFEELSRLVEMLRECDESEKVPDVLMAANGSELPREGVVS
ncbi:MAG: HAD-IIA family hydrolase [Kiritimatiellia bacterium]